MTRRPAATMPAAGILRLQRSAGNRAVRALLRQATTLSALDPARVPHSQ